MRVLLITISISLWVSHSFAVEKPRKPDCVSQWQREARVKRSAAEASKTDAKVALAGEIVWLEAAGREIPARFAQSFIDSANHERDKRTTADFQARRFELSALDAEVSARLIQEVHAGVFGDVQAQIVIEILLSMETDYFEGSVSQIRIPQSIKEMSPFRKKELEEMGLTEKHFLELKAKFAALAQGLCQQGGRLNLNQVFGQIQEYAFSIETL